MEKANADKLARGAASSVDGIVDQIKLDLGVTDEELSFIRPTVVCSVSEKDEVSLGLGLIITMCRMKSKNLSLFFHSDGKIEIAASS